MTVSFYLRHFGGFLIQIGCSTILALIPFWKNGFRFSEKAIALIYGIFTVVASLVFASTIGYLTMENEESVGNFGNLYMLVVVAIVIVAYFLLIKSNFIEKMTVLILVMFYAVTQYMVVNFFTPLLPEWATQELYSSAYFILYLITAVVLFPIMAAFMKIGVRTWMAEIDVKNIKREFVVVFLETVAYIALVIYYDFWSMRTNNDLDNYYWWLVIPPFLLNMVSLFICYWRIFGESVLRRRDEEYRKTAEIQNLRYEAIQQDIETTRRMRHDMRHYLNGLDNMLNHGEYDRMKSFLEEGLGNISRTESKYYCKDDTVNALLEYYVNIAENEDIRCEVQAECEGVAISQVDLTILFGNAMENAIKSCKAFRGERWIKVQIGIVGDCLVTEIKNPCQGVRLSGKYRQDGGFLPADAFVSQSKDGGYGLKSIARIAEKYSGEARYRYDAEDETFTTQIRLNLYAAMEI